MENSFSVVVSHYVKKGKEQAFERALKQVIQKAKSFQGYEGIQTIQLNYNVENEYIVLVRFDTEPNYNTWAMSDVRKQWAQELKQYIIKESEIRYQEGIEFWFSLPEKATAAPPQKWKMALLTFMVIYPLVLTISTLVGFYFNFLHPFLRMLMVSLTLVPLMTYIVMPRVTKLFSAWIFKK